MKHTKKLIALVMVFSVLLSMSACGTTATKSTDASNSSAKAGKIEIVFSARINNSNDTADAVARNYNSDSENTHTAYAVDTDHYAISVTEAERLAWLKNANTAFEKGLAATVNSSAYGKTVKKYEHDKYYQNIKFYGTDEMKGALGALALQLTYTSDQYQAYSLIAPADRVYNIKYYNYKTGKEIKS